MHESVNNYDTFPSSNSTEGIIVDGDWGGDEMQLAAVLLDNHTKVSLLGATAVFGNAPLGNVIRNAGNILSLLNAGHTPYYQGADGPTGGEKLVSDGAHGENGIGGTLLPQTSVSPGRESATNYILKTLASRPEASVTITATGPLTNIAQAYSHDPNTMRRVKEIIIMGGCTEPIPARDMPVRQGNITPHAEFNFYMAPKDAQDVMASGLPITLIPMNCTQQLAFTPERENELAASLKRYPDKRDAIIRMMRAPADLDGQKFGSPPFMHDVNTALYIVRPELYESAVTGTIKICTEGDSKGKSEFEPSPTGNARLIRECRDTNMAFGIVMRSIKACLSSREYLKG